MDFETHYINLSTANKQISIHRTFERINRNIWNHAPVHIYLILRIFYSMLGYYYYVQFAFIIHTNVHYTEFRKCREIQQTENSKDDFTIFHVSFRFVSFHSYFVLCTGTTLDHSTASHRTAQHSTFSYNLNGGIQFDIIFSRGYVQINSIDMDICRRISICVLMREHLHLWNAFANCHQRAHIQQHLDSFDLMWIVSFIIIVVACTRKRMRNNKRLRGARWYLCDVRLFIIVTLIRER